jgi:hypothetical protein
VPLAPPRRATRSASTSTLATLGEPKHRERARPQNKEHDQQLGRIQNILKAIAPNFSFVH